MRNLLARAPQSVLAMVAATVRTICDQPDRAAAEAQLLQDRSSKRYTRNERVDRTRRVPPL
jgi:transposase-like protein